MYVVHVVVLVRRHQHRCSRCIRLYAQRTTLGRRARALIGHTHSTCLQAMQRCAKWIWSWWISSHDVCWCWWLKNELFETQHWWVTLMSMLMMILLRLWLQSSERELNWTGWTDSWVSANYRWLLVVDDFILHCPYSSLASKHLIDHFLFWIIIFLALINNFFAIGNEYTYMWINKHCRRFKPSPAQQCHSKRYRFLKPYFFRS